MGLDRRALGLFLIPISIAIDLTLASKDENTALIVKEIERFDAIVLRLLIFSKAHLLTNTSSTAFPSNVTQIPLDTTELPVSLMTLFIPEEDVSFEYTKIPSVDKDMSIITDVEDIADDDMLNGTDVELIDDGITSNETYIDGNTSIETVNDLEADGDMSYEAEFEDTAGKVTSNETDIEYVTDSGMSSEIESEDIAGEITSKEFDVEYLVDGGVTYETAEDYGLEDETRYRRSASVQDYDFICVSDNVTSEEDLCETLAILLYETENIFQKLLSGTHVEKQTMNETATSLSEVVSAMENNPNDVQFQTITPIKRLLMRIRLFAGQDEMNNKPSVNLNHVIGLGVFVLLATLFLFVCIRRRWKTETVDLNTEEVRNGSSLSNENTMHIGLTCPPEGNVDEDTPVWRIPRPRSTSYDMTGTLHSDSYNLPRLCSLSKINVAYNSGDMKSLSDYGSYPECMEDVETVCEDETVCEGSEAKEQSQRRLSFEESPDKDIDDNVDHSGESSDDEPAFIKTSF